MVSSTEEIFDLIQNATTGAQFYVQKTISYGDILIIWFLTLFTFYLIVKAIWSFFWHKK